MTSRPRIWRARAVIIRVLQDSRCNPTTPRSIQCSCYERLQYSDIVSFHNFHKNDMGEGMDKACQGQLGQLIL